MAYTVNFTDVVNKGSLTVDDGTVNQQTSLALPGRNTTSYGTIIAENFLHLLENFAKNTSPANPVEGQLWYDTTVGVDQLKIYDGTQWVASGGLKKALTQPLRTHLQRSYGVMQTIPMEIKLKKFIGRYILNVMTCKKHFLILLTRMDSYLG